MSKMLILIGVCLVLAGLFWGPLSKLPFGRLPGDIVIQKKSFSFYFPWMTSLLASAVLTFILWLISKK